MKNRHLLNLMGEIEEKYIEEATPLSRKKQIPLFVKVLVAACICIAVGLGYNYLNPPSFESIIKDRPHAELNVAAETTIQVEDYKAVYHEVYAVKYKLKTFIGDRYTAVDSNQWYRIDGYKNLKYLIREDAKGDLSLWRFGSFEVMDEETYTYGDVLRIIYNVDSADDIVSITTSPFNADNSDAGKEMQAEVGTHIYIDKEDILAFYNVVKDVICYGETDENPADFTRFTYSFSVQDGHKLVAKDGIYGTRCISIEFADGTRHDSWKYSALSGTFFEYGSIFTEPMDERDVYTLNEIFGIK